MTATKFQGPRMIVLCSLFLFAAVGIGSCWIIAYGAYWPEWYGVSMTPLGFGPTVMGVIGLIAGFTSIDAIIEKFGAKTMFLIDSICLIAAVLLWAFIPQMWAYYLGWALIGITQSSMFATATHVVVQWYYHKRQRMIGIVVGVSSFGMVVFQFASGYLFPAFGLTGGFVVFAIIGGAMVLISTFGIKEHPESVGQHALGYEDDPERLVEQSVQESREGNNKKAKSLSRILYATPSFWFLIIAFLLMANGPSIVSSYGSLFLPEYGGMSVTDASTFISLCSLGTTLILMFAMGPFVNKFHAKGALVLCGLASIGSLVCMIVYMFVSPTFGVLVPMYFTYIIGFCISNLSNYIAPDLYGTVLSTAANVKFQTITKCSSLWVGPVTAAVVDLYGVAGTPVVLLCTFTLGFVLSMVALGIYAKRDKKKIDGALDLTSASAPAVD